MFGAHDLPYIFPEQLKAWVSVPLTWIIPNHDALGEYGVTTMWSWPLKFIYGLGGKLGFDYNLLTIILGIFPFVIFGIWGIWRIFKEYRLHLSSQLIATLFFLFNPFTLMLIDGGQVNLAVVYSLLPLAFSYRQKPLILSLFSLVISIYDIRFIAFLFGLLLLKLNIKSIIISLLVVLGFNAYWLFPALLVKLPQLPTTYTRSSQVSFLSFANFSQSLAFYQPHWPKNIFGNTTQANPYLLILPLFVFLSLILYRKNKNILYWSIVAIGSIFLAKGSNPPLEFAYQWLFVHLPGFSLFRDPIKFYMLIGLSYSVLLGFVVEKMRDKKLFWVVVCGFYGIFLLTPFFTNQITGLLSPPRNKENYLELAKYVQNSTEGGILWIPAKPPLGYSDVKHPSTDALTLLSRRPFLSGSVGSYELLNFLRESKSTPYLLKTAGVRYLAIAGDDYKRDSQKPEDIKYRNLFATQLESLPWVKQSRNFGALKLLELEESNTILSLQNKLDLVAGGDDFELTSPTIYIDSSPELSLFPKENFIFPAKQLDFNPGSNGWWKRETIDLVSWRDFLQTKYGLDNRDFDYGGGVAISEGEHRLDIKLNSKCLANCILLARVMKSVKGGEIKINQYEINTKADLGTTILTLMPKTLTFKRAKFEWYELGPIVNNQDLVISTQGDLNAINALVIISKNELEKYKDNNFLKVFGEDTPRLEYQKINWAKYKVKILGLKNPKLLVFAQNYDSLWELSGLAPLPIDNLVNGYIVNSDGDYVLEYLPQKYVYYGLVVSACTIVIIFILCGIFFM